MNKDTQKKMTIATAALFIVFTAMATVQVQAKAHTSFGVGAMDEFISTGIMEKFISTGMMEKFISTDNAALSTHDEAMTMSEEKMGTIYSFGNAALNTSDEGVYEDSGHWSFAHIDVLQSTGLGIHRHLGHTV